MQIAPEKIGRNIFVCNRCTICCTEPVVPITDKDVMRIMRGSGEHVSTIIRFYSTSEMEYDSEAPLWISFTYGRRAMGLRKRNGHCRFLVHGDACSVYAHRPMTCRTFPYQIEVDESDCIKSVSVNKAIDCRCKQIADSSQQFAKVMRDINREDHEDWSYHDKVSAWNSRKPRVGGTRDFLEFIGLL